MPHENYGPHQLDKVEIFWRDHQQWLQQCGYMLRPRYMPDWFPSWMTTDEHGNRIETGKFYAYCEDSCVHVLANTMNDARRISDGHQVMLKVIKPSVHPYEADIGRFFSSESRASDPKNHCVPIYEVLKVPDIDDRVILVMPLLRLYDKPPFQTVGEAVDLFGQLFEGLQFMHKHHVAHRDCMYMNIMMDDSMFPEGWHAVRTNMDVNCVRGVKYSTRTERPPKYYFIDFGISRKYDPRDGPPLEDPIIGGDRTVPEFQNSDEPCDPFPTDIYYLGNVIRGGFIKKQFGCEFMDSLVKEMTQDDPAKRPTIDEVIVRFEAIRKRLGPVKLRARIGRRKESFGVFRDVGHVFKIVKYTLQGVPAIPSRNKVPSLNN